MAVTLMDDTFTGGVGPVAGRTVGVLTWSNITDFDSATLDGSGNAVGTFGLTCGNSLAFDSSIMSEEISIGVRLSSVLYSNSDVITLTFGTAAAGEVLVIDGRTDSTCRIILNGSTRASGLSLSGVLVELVVDPVALTVQARVGGTPIYSTTVTRTISPVCEVYIGPHFGGGVGGTVPKLDQVIVFGADPPPPVPSLFWMNLSGTREV